MGLHHLLLHHLHQMMIRTIRNIQDFCLWATIIVVIGSNFFNYFYCYQYLDDRLLQWKVAMVSISFSMFLMSIYMWLHQHLRNKNIGILASGYLSLYLLINFVGVLIGYNLHTKGFMMVMFVASFFGFCHILTKLWSK